MRLEALVEETLMRQLRIDESRRAGLEAAQRLTEKMKDLTESMSQCLMTAKKAHSAAVGAAFSAMQARTKARAESDPMSHVPRTEKKFMN